MRHNFFDMSTKDWQEIEREDSPSAFSKWMATKPPNRITMGASTFEKLMGEGAQSSLSIIPPEEARYCGNCKHYSFMSYTCFKSDRKGLADNTKCFTGQFKEPERSKGQ